MMAQGNRMNSCYSTKIFVFALFRKIKETKHEISEKAPAIIFAAGNSML